MAARSADPTGAGGYAAIVHLIKCASVVRAGRTGISIAFPSVAARSVGLTGVGGYAAIVHLIKCASAAIASIC